MLKHKKLVTIMVIVSLLVSSTFVSTAKAVSLTNASDRLSTSNMSASATHTITFTTSVALGVGDYFQITIPGNQGFGSIATSSIACPANSTSSAPATTTAKCTATGVVAAGIQTITLTGIANPAAAGSQTISAYNYASTSLLRESANMMVAVISNVSMSATVPSTLTFTISPLATGTVVNTATTTGMPATTSVAFGNLQAGTTTTMAQQLTVLTNAYGGFKVTIQQNQPLTSNGNATIDSFKDGVVPGTPTAWTAPTVNIGATSTYGHMGFTTDDISLSTGNPFAGGTFSGLNGTSTSEVMYNGGPADATTTSVGKVNVAYRVQISALQEAGDYANVITYIATPIY